MRFAVWAYTATIGLVSLAVMAIGGMVSNIYEYRFERFNGKPLPALTNALIDSHGWPLAFPALWVCAAVWLSRPAAATPSRVFALASVTTLTITFLCVFMAVAAILPFMSLIINLH